MDLDGIAIWIHLVIAVGTVLVTVVSVILSMRSNLRELRASIERLATADHEVWTQLRKVEDATRQDIRDIDRRVQDHSTRFARGGEQIAQTQRAIQALMESLSRVEEKLDQVIMQRDRP